MALATPDHGALKAKFKVIGGPEADLLDVYPGVARIDHVGDACRWVGFVRWIGHIGVPAEFADHKIVAKRPGEQGEQWNVERLDAVDAEGIDVFGVVGVGHAAAQPRSKPVVLFAEGDFVIEEVGRDVSLHDPCIRRGGDWPHGDGGLIVDSGGVAVRRCCRRYVEACVVHRAERLGQRLGVAGS